MKMTVVELDIDGETRYLTDRKSLADAATTANVTEAKNYEGRLTELDRDLLSVAAPGDEKRLRGGGPQASALPQVVELDGPDVELSRRVGRKLLLLRGEKDAAPSAPSVPRA